MNFLLFLTCVKYSSAVRLRKEVALGSPVLATGDPRHLWAVICGPNVYRLEYVEGIQDAVSGLEKARVAIAKMIHEEESKPRQISVRQRGSEETKSLQH